ncbi:MAG: thiol peroxidase [Anaerolineales bacterium]|nr:thiol peroxidase [Anaerolineales bacterium]
MTVDRKGIVKFEGQDQTVVGPDLKAGDIAPDFAATTLEWKSSRPLKETAGKVRILAAVLSLETSVCDRETRVFNQEASALGPDVHTFILSTDLPFTQGRWCGAAGMDRVTTLSDHAQADFGTKYGCLLKESRILRRAVFVVGRDDKLVYADYMQALGDEPKYAEVLAAARLAL